VLECDEMHRCTRRPFSTRMCFRVSITIRACSTLDSADSTPRSNAVIRGGTKAPPLKISQVTDFEWAPGLFGLTIGLVVANHPRISFPWDTSVFRICMRDYSCPRRFLPVAQKKGNVAASAFRASEAYRYLNIFFLSRCAAQNHTDNESALYKYRKCIISLSSR